LPAAEALLDLPRAAHGDPACERPALPVDEIHQVERGATWRFTIADRRDIGTGEVYGIALHLVPRERGASVG
jgi:hypothetical protein